MTFKQARVIAGFTQEEVAKRLGLTRSTVANWENGTTKPTITNKRKIVDLFGIKIEDFDFLCPDDLVKLNSN